MTDSDTLRTNAEALAIFLGALARAIAADQAKKDILEAIHTSLLWNIQSYQKRPAGLRQETAKATQQMYLTLKQAVELQS